MDRTKQERKLIKGYFRGMGILLLAQEAVMFFVVFIYGLVAVVNTVLTHSESDAAVTRAIDALEQSGMPYIIAALFAFIPILIYRKKRFFTYDLKVAREKITVKAAVLGFLFVFGVSGILSFLSAPLELLLNLFGLTAAPSLAALEESTTWGMFLYTVVVAPLFEECLFRGVVLRSLERFGDTFAITASALLFSMMHGNVLQVPYAFGAGLILGYLALRYSLKLTILIHAANNLAVELFGLIPSEFWMNWLQGILLAIVMAVLAAVIYKNKRKAKTMLAAFHNRRPDKRLWFCFFTSIPMLLFLLSCIAEALLGIERM